MNKNNIGKVLALVIAALTVLAAFAGMAGKATVKDNDASAARLDLTAPTLETASPKMISPEKAVMRSMEGTLSKGGSPQPNVVHTADSFENDVVGDTPDNPPWTTQESTSNPTAWGTYTFANDTNGNIPANPPWQTIDGQNGYDYYWKTMEDATSGQTLDGAYWSGTQGRFYGMAGDATLTAQAPPAGGPPATIDARFTRGTMSARFNEGTDTNAQSIFGPIGIEAGGNVDHAFAGGQIYFSTTATQRLDLYVYDYNTGGAAILIVLYAGAVYWFPGGTQTALTGATIVEGFNGAATYLTDVLADAVVLKRGQGYWVYVPADTTWTVNW